MVQRDNSGLFTGWWSIITALDLSLYQLALSEWSGTARVENPVLY